MDASVRYRPETHVLELDVADRKSPQVSFTHPLGGSKTSLRVFGEGCARLWKTLPGRSFLTADPPSGRVKLTQKLSWLM